MPLVSSCLNADDQKGQGLLRQRYSESLMLGKCSFVNTMGAKQMACNMNTVQLGRAKLSVDLIQILCPPKPGQLLTQHRDTNEEANKKRDHINKSQQLTTFHSEPEQNTPENLLKNDANLTTHKKAANLSWYCRIFAGRAVTSGVKGGDDNRGQWLCEI